MRMNKRISTLVVILLLSVVLVGCTTKSNGNDTDGQKDQGNTPQQKDLSPRVIVDKQGRIIGTAGLEDATSLSIDFSWISVEDGSEWKGYDVMSGAFSDCPKLKDVWVGDDLLKQPVNMAEDAFAGCDPDLVMHIEDNCKWKPAILKAGLNWEESEITDYEEVYKSKAPYYVMSETGACLGMSYSMHDRMETEGNVTFPKDTTYIAEGVCNYAFSGIQEVVIPENVTEIGQFAFREMLTGLDDSPVKLTFGGKNLKKIGESAFDSCQLGEVEIPEGVEEIGQQSFFGCTTMTKITLPSTLKSAGESCIAGPSELTEIVIKSKDATIELPYDNEHLTVYCYEDSAEYRYIQKHYDGVNVKLLQ